MPRPWPRTPARTPARPCACRPVPLLGSRRHMVDPEVGGRRRECDGEVAERGRERLRGAKPAGGVDRQHVLPAGHSRGSRVVGGGAGGPHRRE